MSCLGPSGGVERGVNLRGPPSLVNMAIASYLALDNVGKLDLGPTSVIGNTSWARECPTTSRFPHAASFDVSSRFLEHVRDVIGLTFKLWPVLDETRQ